MKGDIQSKSLDYTLGCECQFGVNIYAVQVCMPARSQYLGYECQRVVHVKAHSLSEGSAQGAAGKSVCCAGKGATACCTCSGDLVAQHLDRRQQLLPRPPCGKTNQPAQLPGMS